jgi:hypothetical protein
MIFSKLFGWNGPIFLLILTMLLPGCAQSNPRERRQGEAWVKLIASGIHGTSRNRIPSIKWITTPEQFRDVIAELGKQQFSESKGNVPIIDFEQYRVLWIEMGQQTTGGYALSLDQESSDRSSGIAVIRVNWSKPQEGAILAQIITAPYLLLKLAKNNYRRILIKDQGNHILFNVAAPKM